MEFVVPSSLLKTLGVQKFHLILVFSEVVDLDVEEGWVGLLIADEVTAVGFVVVDF